MNEAMKLIFLAYIVCFVYADHFQIFKLREERQGKKTIPQRHYFLIDHDLHELVGEHLTETLHILGYKDLPVTSELELSRITSSYGKKIEVSSSSSALDRLIQLSNDIYRIQGVFNKTVSLKSHDIRPIMKYDEYTHLAVSSSNTTGDMNVHWIGVPGKRKPKSTLMYQTRCNKAVTIDGAPVENIRAVVINPSHLHLIYAMQQAKAIGVTDLIENEKSHCYEVSMKKVIKPISKNSASYNSYWSPVYMEGQLFYISQINPFTVVEVNEHPIIKNSNVHNVSVLSSDYKFDVFQQSRFWSTSELIGGCNAIEIGRNKFLSFFTSRIKLAGTDIYHYFLGAYTFSTKTIPFRIVEMSPFPIAFRNWYTNSTSSPAASENENEIHPISVLPNGDIVTLVVESKNQGNMMLSFALQKLLNSMEKLSTRAASSFSQKKDKKYLK
jgi:hypothetical protein